MPVRSGTVVALIAASLAGCSYFKPYKPEVVQGNFVSREQVQALRIGMPRQTVRDILGTPLVTSVFHADRWDYVFTIRREGAEPQQRRLTVYFSGDTLARVEGDSMPTEAEFAAKLDTRRPPSKLPPLQASEAELAKFPPPPRAAEAAQTAASQPTTRVYPPLEPAR